MFVCVCVCGGGGGGGAGKLHVGLHVDLYDKTIPLPWRLLNQAE